MPKSSRNPRLTWRANIPPRITCHSWTFERPSLDGLRLVSKYPGENASLHTPSPVLCISSSGSDHSLVLESRRTTVEVELNFMKSFQNIEGMSINFARSYFHPLATFEQLSKAASISYGLQPFSCLLGHRPWKRSVQNFYRSQVVSLKSRVELKLPYFVRCRS